MKIYRNIIKYYIIFYFLFSQILILIKNNYGNICKHAGFKYHFQKIVKTVKNACKAKIDYYFQESTI